MFIEVLEFGVFIIGESSKITKTGQNYVLAKNNLAIRYPDLSVLESIVLRKKTYF